MSVCCGRRVLWECTHHRVVEELLELTSFLKARGTEGVGAALLSTAPASLASLEGAAAERMAASVAAALESLTARPTQDLLLVHAAGRFLERQAAGLEAKRAQEAKLQV